MKKDLAEAYTYWNLIREPQDEARTYLAIPLDQCPEMESPLARWLKELPKVVTERIAEKVEKVIIGGLI